MRSLGETARFPQKSRRFGLDAPRAPKCPPRRGLDFRHRRHRRRPADNRAEGNRGATARSLDPTRWLPRMRRSEARNKISDPYEWFLLPTLVRRRPAKKTGTRLRIPK